MATVIQHPSANCTARRGGAAARLVVLHYTAMDDVDEVLARLCDADAQVSAHYLITRGGENYQLVAEDLRAWHAGAGQWGGIADVNSHSIGIELMNSGAPDYPRFPPAQMDALAGLLRGIMARHNIAPKAVIGHSDLAVGRKGDPGPAFDWQGLARQGLAVWPKDLEAEPPADWTRFITDAKTFGYCPPQDSPQGWHEVLKTFRLRFAPERTGELDPRDMATIHALARDYPCEL